MPDWPDWPSCPTAPIGCSAPLARLAHACHARLTRLAIMPDWSDCPTGPTGHLARLARLQLDCSLPAAERRLAGVDASPARCGLNPHRPCVEGGRWVASCHRSCSQWWSCSACGTQSRRGAGAHCALPPGHGRTMTCCALCPAALSRVSLPLVCVCVLCLTHVSVCALFSSAGTER